MGLCVGKVFIATTNQTMSKIGICLLAFVVCASAVSVTYRPGGPATGTIFTDFGALAAYIQTSIGDNRWTIQIDGSFSGGSPSIPTGVYPMPYAVRFVGLPNPAYPGTSYPTLAGASDVVLQPPPVELAFRNLPYIEFLNIATPVVTVNNSLDVDLENCAIFGANVFSAVRGGLINFNLYTFASLGLGSPIVSVDSTSTVIVGVLDGSFLPANTFTVAVGGVVDVYAVDSSNVDPSYQATFLSLASQISGIQSGEASLSLGGQSHPIVAIVTATSRITVSHNHQNGTSVGTLLVPKNLRVIGNPGSFVVKSVDLSGVRVHHDHGSFDWHIIDTGK
jgi:hypothetical protein